MPTSKKYFKKQKATNICRLVILKTNKGYGFFCCVKKR